MRKHVSFTTIMAMIASMVTMPAQAARRWHPRVTHVDAYHGSELQYGIESVVSIPRGITQGLARDLCNNHRGTGDAMEYSWCYGQVTNSWGQVVDYNPYATYQNNPITFGWGRDGYYYDTYGRRYRRGNNGTLELAASFVAGGVVGAGVMALSRANKGNANTPAKCVDQMLKSFKAAKMTVSSEQVMAMCTGQPIPQSPAQAPAPTPQPAAAPTLAQTVTVPARTNETMAVNKTQTKECITINGQKTDYNVGRVVNENALQAGLAQGSHCKGLKAERTAQGTLELTCTAVQ